MAYHNGNGLEELDDEFRETFRLIGREFQRKAVEDETYLCPVDNLEAERLDHLHEIFKREFTSPEIPNGLVLAPLFPDRQHTVLDCGYGSAAWAVDVAQQYPRWNVVGVDIWPFMAPERDLPNLDLQVADLNDRFTFSSSSFDLVHSRMISGGLAHDRWRTYLQDIYRVLRPGGWLQMFEIYFNIQSYSGRLEGSALRQWSHEYMRSLALSDNPTGRKDCRIHNRMNELIRQSGLVLDTHTRRDLHLSAWSPDPQRAEIGNQMRNNMRELLRSSALYPFTQRLSQTRDAFEVLVASAREELDDLANKPYISLYVWRAQKPRR